MPKTKNEVSMSYLATNVITIDDLRVDEIREGVYDRATILTKADATGIIVKEEELFFFALFLDNGNSLIELYEAEDRDDGLYVGGELVLHKMTLAYAAQNMPPEP